MNEKLGIDLHPDDKKKVLNAYLYRMTVESIARWPEATRQVKGFKMPIITDAQWLSRTFFAVRKDGRLDDRRRSCRCER